MTKVSIKGRFMMSKIKFQDKIQVTIYDDDHEIYLYDDFQKVSCPKVEEIYTVSSNMGTLRIYCPGCGEEL